MKALRLLLKLILIPVYVCVLFLGSAFITNNITYKAIAKNGVSSINDPRIPESKIKQLTSILKPFKSIYDTTYDINQKVTIEYGLDSVIKCYLETNKGSSDSLYKYLLKTEGYLPPINWNNVQLPDSGFYEGDNCFVNYVNPDKGFSIDRLHESAVFGEMLIRKVLGNKIKLRVDFHPSDHVESLSFEDNPKYKDYKFTFGVWDPYYETIFLNTSADSTKRDISWRLIHEMNHAFSYGDENHIVAAPSSYAVPEEMLAEFISDYIANNTGRKLPKYSPAIIALLPYVNEEELVDLYMNGSAGKLRDKIDAQTYPGAFCTYAYYLAKLDAYGHEESDLYEKALSGTTPRIADMYLDCVRY